MNYKMNANLDAIARLEEMIDACLAMGAEAKPNLTYKQKELMRASEKHDWAYPMSLKLSGTENSGNTISVSKEQFEKLLKIFA